MNLIAYKKAAIQLSTFNWIALICNEEDEISKERMIQMIYQCTKDMITTLKKESEAKPDIYNPLFSWNVKVMKVNRRNLVYLMNDASKLSIILYGMTQKEFKDFDEHVKQGIKEILEDCNVPNTLIQQYLDQSGVAIFTSSGTRKQVGVLTQAARDVETFFEELVETGILQRRLCQHQNRSIVKNDDGEYITPQEIMKDLLVKTFGGNGVKFDLGEIALNMFVSDRMEMEPFLNIKNGDIYVAEEGTDEFEDIDFNDDFVHIPIEYFDFFRCFNGFAEGVKNNKFQQDLDRLEYGRGAIRRVKDLLYEYPDIQEQWYEYQEQAENEIVREWLESLGLM